MTDIKFLSYNVKGLNSHIKRHKILAEITQYRADIVYLQETHITLESNIKLYSSDYPVWYYGDTVSSRSRGVAIGFARGVRCTLVDRLNDPEGRFLFLKVKLGEEDYTLANVYAPNVNSAKYISKILRKLKGFEKGHVVLMGDFNFCMCPSLDSTSHAQGNNGEHLKILKKQMIQNQMVDVWRIFNPKTRDYTFFSPVHGTYSRIDYILVDHRLLERVVEASCEIITLSDHAPITMKISTSIQKCSPPEWRLDEGLLRDEDVVERVQKELEWYFQENDKEGSQEQPCGTPTKRI